MTETRAKKRGDDAGVLDMSPTAEILVGICLAVAALGTIVPILPGAFLAAGVVLLWSVITGGLSGWAVGIFTVVVLGLSQVLKYLIPGKKLAGDGVPNRSILLGSLLGVVGFFVVPVVGLILGFVLGVYLSELQRTGTFESAWPSTRSAMAATGLSILIELGAVLVVSAAWLTAVVTT